ncbi:hypothetical protein KCU65_g483, partial [Aureobasidium melanogenum]
LASYCWGWYSATGLFLADVAINPPLRTALFRGWSNESGSVSSTCGSQVCLTCSGVQFWLCRCETTKRILSNKLFKAIGRRSLSYYLVSTILMYTAGIKIFLYCNVQQGIGSASAKAVAFFLVLPCSIIVAGQSIFYIVYIYFELGKHIVIFNVDFLISFSKAEFVLRGCWKPVCLLSGPWSHLQQHTHEQRRRYSKDVIPCVCGHRYGRGTDIYDFESSESGNAMRSIEQHDVLQSQMTTNQRKVFYRIGLCRKLYLYLVYRSRLYLFPFPHRTLFLFHPSLQPPSTHQLLRPNSNRNNPSKYVQQEFRDDQVSMRHPSLATLARGCMSWKESQEVWRQRGFPEGVYVEGLLFADGVVLLDIVRDFCGDAMRYHISTQRHYGILDHVYQDTKPCTRHLVQHFYSILEYNARISAIVSLQWHFQGFHLKDRIVG